MNKVNEGMNWLMCGSVSYTPTLTKNDIVIKVYNDPSVNKYINKLVVGTDKREFKQHICCILLEKDIDWLMIRVVDPSFFTASCLAIIRNQYINKNESYWKNNQFNKEYIEDKMINISNEDEYDSELDNMVSYIDNHIINNLRADHYIQYKLHFYYGLSLKEISSKTGVNYQTIRLNIIKVISIIKDRLPEKIKRKYE